jgi:hypothetical protein
MTQYPSLDCPYIELTRGLTWKEVEEVEDECNQLIADDLSIWVETNIQDSKIDGEGDRESRGIPKDYEGVCHHFCHLLVITYDRVSFDISTLME